MIEIEKVINYFEDDTLHSVITYFEDGRSVSIKRFHLHNCVPVVVTRVTHHPDRVRKESFRQ